MTMARAAAAAGGRRRPRRRAAAPAVWARPAPADRPRHRRSAAAPQERPGVAGPWDSERCAALARRGRAAPAGSKVAKSPVRRDARKDSSRVRGGAPRARLAGSAAALVALAQSRAWRTSRARTPVRSAAMPGSCTNPSCSAYRAAIRSDRVPA
eukprot:gene651-biopygen452